MSGCVLASMWHEMSKTDLLNYTQCVTCTTHRNIPYLKIVLQESHSVGQVDIYNS